MDGVLKLHESYRIVKALAPAVIVDGKPLLYYAHVDLGLPDAKPKLSAQESHKLLHLRKVILHYEHYLAVVAVWYGGIENRVFLIAIGYLSEEMTPYRRQLYVVYFLRLQIRIAALEGETVDIVNGSVK